MLVLGIFYHESFFLLFLYYKVIVGHYFFYIDSLSMQKDPTEPVQQKQWGQLELNQQGRPKQKVVFYQLTQEMKKQAQEAISKDQIFVNQQQYEIAVNSGQKVWDKFYQYHKCNFFKDRTYLQRQMPEITYFKEYHKQINKVSNYYQLGCGVGNTLFPLLRQFECFNYYGCDISAKAIKLIQEQVQKHPQLDHRIKVCVCDLVKHQIPYPQLGDLNSLIFVLSAIAPEQHQYVANKVAQSMKPGSFLFFRDYGRYDFGQLNLTSKGKRKLRDNFYKKNDGVCVYYFQEQELKALFQKAGLTTIKIRLHCKLLQNRKKGLKMYRVWIQGRFYKGPLHPYFYQKMEKQLEKEAIQEKQRIKEGQQVEQIQQLEEGQKIKVQKQQEAIKKQQKLEQDNVE